MEGLLLFHTVLLPGTHFKAKQVQREPLGAIAHS